MSKNNNDSIFTITDEGDNCAIMRFYSRGNLDFIPELFESKDEEFEVNEELENLLNAITSILIENHVINSAKIRVLKSKYVHVIFVGNRSACLADSLLNYIRYIILEKGDTKAFGNHVFVFHIYDPIDKDDLLDLAEFIIIDDSYKFVLDSSKSHQFYRYELNDSYEAKSIENIPYKNKKDRDRILDEMREENRKIMEESQNNQLLILSNEKDYTVMKVYNRGHLETFKDTDEVVQYLIDTTLHLVQIHYDEMWEYDVKDNDIIHVVFSDKHAHCYLVAVVNYIHTMYTKRNTAFANHYFMIHCSSENSGLLEEVINCPIIKWDGSKEFELYKDDVLCKYTLDDNYDVKSILEVNKND